MKTCSGCHSVSGAQAKAALANCERHRCDRTWNHMAVGQNETSRGPQVLVLGSIYRVPFWVPIFDPQPHIYGVAKPEACRKTSGDPTQGGFLVVWFPVRKHQGGVSNFWDSPMCHCMPTDMCALVSLSLQSACDNHARGKDIHVSGEILCGIRQAPHNAKVVIGRTTDSWS